MKLFAKSEIEKFELNAVTGGQDPGTETDSCTGTTYWAGYGIGHRSDESKDGDWVPAC